MKDDGEDATSIACPSANAGYQVNFVVVVFLHDTDAVCTCVHKKILLIVCYYLILFCRLHLHKICLQKKGNTG